MFGVAEHGAKNAHSPAVRHGSGEFAHFLAVLAFERPGDGQDCAGARGGNLLKRLQQLDDSLLGGNPPEEKNELRILR